MNPGRQFGGWMLSSFICGKRKSGGPSWAATRLPRSSPIDLPVPEAEDEHVGQPDQRTGDDQLAAVAYPVSQELAAEEDERGGVCCTDKSCEAEREFAAEVVLMFELLRSGDCKGDEQRPFERGQQPGGPGRDPLGQKQLETDRREHRRLRRPNRLWLGGRRIEPPGK